jgi:endonuclease/exonuclease/phosphatase family metal-dependent hydrolase
MRRSLLLLVVGLAGGVPPLAGGTPAAPVEPVRLMSFNILHSLNPLPPAAWRHRRPLVWEVIRRHAPDIVALQEVLADQWDDFTAEFGAVYETVGHGHAGPRDGEILPVAWRRDRFERIRHEFFWLSATPDVVGSKGWGGFFPRVVTLVHLRDRRDGRELVVVNNHWESDNDRMEARQRSAELVLERTAGIPPDRAVFLVGDFNIVPTREKRRAPYRRLTEEGSPPPFRDAWLAAGERRGPDTTTNRLKSAPSLQPGERKDWILYRGPVRPVTMVVDDFHRDGIHPSDHLPIILAFVWEDPPR